MQRGKSAESLSPSRHVGVWIDHRRACVVELAGKSVRYEEVASNLEPRHKAMGGTKVPGRSFMKAFFASEKNQTRARMEHERRFYEAVVRALLATDGHWPERVVVLGPGRAKQEFVRELNRQGKSAASVAAIVPAMRLTRRQLIAEVRRQFH
jgi:hypothetical protein